MFTIDSSFEGGSIEVLDARDPGNVRLNLKRDPNAEESYWFYFRLVRRPGQDLSPRDRERGRRLPARLSGEGTDVPGPYQGYRACGSSDLDAWFRVPTDLRERQARHHRDARTGTAIFLASFPPYQPRAAQPAHRPRRCRTSRDRHRALPNPGREPRSISCKSARRRAEKTVCWVTARQHPSETMAEWFAEGLVDRLVDPDDALARKLLDECVFHVVPCMNPDGARRGNTRRNGGFVDLNREWVEPSPEASPEVFHVRDLMHRTGVDFYMDVHGDEELPCVFLGGPLEVPSLTPAMRENFRAFQRALEQVNPDYRTGYPYPGGPPPTANLQMSWNYVGETFQCLSILVEQPFKDCAHAPDPEKGYSPERAYRLGAASLVALNAVHPNLR